jgi:hypothetical protein
VRFAHRYGTVRLIRVQPASLLECRSIEQTDAIAAENRRRLEEQISCRELEALAKTSMRQVIPDRFNLELRQEESQSRVAICEKITVGMTMWRD